MAKERIAGKYKTEEVALLVDEPVIGVDEDILGLKPFADVIAGAALGTNGPFTIGVYADWGEGKTSVLRLAKDLVERNNENIVTAWFNAWQYGKEEHPIVPLVSTIAKAVNEKLRTKEKIAGPLKAGLSKLSMALRAIAYGFSATGKVSVPGFGELEAGFVAKEMIERYEQLQKGEDPLIEKTLYYNAFELLDSISSQADEKIETPKIAVFIDDLDRCNPPEAIKLLESIKLVLSQKGFIFVLALDIRILQGFLKYRYEEEFKVGDYETAGKDYLDKIIQLPLPLLPHEKRFKTFIGKLLESNKALNHKSNQPVKDVISDLQEVLSKGSRFNPRNLIRFLNNLIIDGILWKSIGGGKADTDVMGFCVISRILRDHFKDDRLYEYLWKNQNACDDIRDFVLKRETPAVIKLSTKEELGKEGYGSPAKINQIIVKLSQMEFLQEVLATGQGKSWLENQKMREAVNEFIVTQRKEEETKQESQDDEKIFDYEIRRILNTPTGAISEDLYKTIKELDLTNRGMKSLSANIVKLSNLERFDVKDNQLTTLPGAIAKLTNLQSLYLSNNHFIVLPEVICKLTNLVELNLDDNRLIELPEWISKLTNLQVFSLHGNQLIALPDVIANLTDLRGLNISDNKLTIFPEAIAKLSNLQTFYLHDNHLTDLPENIGSLINLKELHLNFNKLTALPKAIGNLMNLKELSLYRNQLTTLPETIGNLTNLKNLYLGDNQLTSLPVTIGKLTNLQFIYLVGNKFSMEERERIKQILPKSCSYQFEADKGETD